MFRSSCSTAPRLLAAVSAERSFALVATNDRFEPKADTNSCGKMLVILIRDSLGSFGLVFPATWGKIA